VKSNAFGQRGQRVAEKPNLVDDTYSYFKNMHPKQSKQNQHWIVTLVVALALPGCIISSRQPDRATIEGSTRVLQVRAIDDLPKWIRSDVENTAQNTNLTTLQEAFLRDQKRRIARQNEQVIARAIRMQAAGGFEAAVRKELGELRSQIKQPPSGSPSPMRNPYSSRIAELEKVIDVTYHCVKPTVLFLNGSSISPGANEMIAIFGCSFGDKEGDVRLLMNPAMGTYFSLTVLDASILKPGEWIAFSDTDLVIYRSTFPGLKTWTTNVILAKLNGPVPGYLDQPAQIVVIRSDGTQSEPYPVQFYQRRVIQYVDDYIHPGVVGARCSDASNDDWCKSFVRTNANPYLNIVRYGAHHRRFYNPTQASGTDKWFVRLKNGWKPLHWGQEYWDPVMFEPVNGLFSSYEEVGDAGPLLQGGRVDRFTFKNYPGAGGAWVVYEADVDWWVDGWDSLIFYWGSIPIIGPEGAAYW